MDSISAGRAKEPDRACKHKCLGALNFYLRNSCSVPLQASKADRITLIILLKPYANCDRMIVDLFLSFKGIKYEYRY